MRKEKDYQKSLMVYGQASEIMTRCLGSSDVEVADIMQNRALVYIDQNRFALAEEELLRASDIISNALGRDHPKMGYCLHKRGLLAAAQHQEEEAGRLMQFSLETLRASLDKHHPEVADV